MKGKKGAAAPPAQTNVDGEFEEDGLCCTCGQQVGQQHHHVPSTHASGQKANAGGGGGGTGHVHNAAVKGK